MKTIKEFFTGRSNNVTNELTFKDVENKVTESQTLYYCPMKCEGDKTYPQSGNCPVCNMNLVPTGTMRQSAHTHEHHGCC
jgi:Cu2+-exporting ATPase